MRIASTWRAVRSTSAPEGAASPSTVTGFAPASGTELHVDDDMVQAMRAYRVIGRHLTEMVSVMRGGRLVWVSETVEHLTGYSRGALIADGLPEGFLHSGSVCRLPGAAGGERTLRGRVRLADGTMRWFEHRLVGDPDEPDVCYVTSRDIDEEVKLEQMLGAGDPRLRRAVDASPDGLVLLRVARDATDRPAPLSIIFLNSAAAAHHDGHPTELIGDDVERLLPTTEVAVVRSSCLLAVTSGEAQQVRVQVTGEDRPVTLDCHVEPMDDETVLLLMRDVSDLVAAQADLLAAYERASRAQLTLDMALDAATDGFLVVDLHAIGDTWLEIIHANPAATRHFGAQVEDMVRTGAETLVPGPPGRLRHLVEQALDSEAPVNERIVEEQPELSALDLTVAPVGEKRCVVISRDVTDAERLERYRERRRLEAEHRATHDDLTGLANRAGLAATLNRALAECTADQRVGVVFIDLDGFKAINDTHGHAAGDAVLRAVAGRLTSLARRDDLAARMSGDEFVVVLRYLPPGWDASSFAERAAVALAHPVPVGDHMVTPAASFGVVIADPSADPDDRDTEALLRRADARMYEHKRHRAAARV